MTPLEFLQRLAALVPRPRLHLIRFHGVLAPNAALRSQIVPSESDQATAASNANGEAPRSLNAGAHELGAITQTRLRHRPHHLSTVQRPLDPSGSPFGWLRTGIEDPAVIIKILGHLGWPTRAPPKAPARLDAFLHTA